MKALSSLISKAYQAFSLEELDLDTTGKQVVTRDLQQAIDQIAEKGGGTLFFPPGIYLSGGLQMRSHVSLYLSAGATLLGSTNFEDYSVSTEIGNGFFFTPALLTAHQVENVSIMGEGMINGNGGEYVLPPCQSRPMNLVFSRCRGIRVLGVTLKNSAMWMQLYDLCDDVLVEGITVDNFVNHNNDSIDICDCRNVRISNCLFMSDDDGITFKSFSERGSENVLVTNCTVQTHCNAIKFGTESYGGYRNVVVSNCSVSPVPLDRRNIEGWVHGCGAIALESADGGIMRGIVIHNIVIDGYEVPIFIRLQNRARAYGHSRRNTGSIQDIRLSNIVATNAGVTGCSITGIPGHDLQNIALSNISIRFKGVKEEEVHYNGFVLKASEIPVPEYAGDEKYPNPPMFGILPTFGFFCRHVTGLSMRDIYLEHAIATERPAYQFCDIKNLHLNHLAGGVEVSLLTQRNVQGLVL